MPKKQYTESELILLKNFIESCDVIINHNNDDSNNISNSNSNNSRSNSDTIAIYNSLDTKTMINGLKVICEDIVSKNPSVISRKPKPDRVYTDQLFLALRI